MILARRSRTLSGRRKASAVMRRWTGMRPRDARRRTSCESSGEDAVSRSVQFHALAEAELQEASDYYGQCCRVSRRYSSTRSNVVTDFLSSSPRLVCWYDRGCANLCEALSVLTVLHCSPGDDSHRGGGSPQSTAFLLETKALRCGGRSAQQAGAANRPHSPP